MSSLLATFSNLPTPSRGQYSTEPARGQRCRIGRSTENHPVVLIAFQRESDSTAVRLANLEYRPPADVEVIGESVRPRVAILECKTNDAALVGYFLRVAQTLIFDDLRTEDEAHFLTSLDTIIRLFRALQRPGSRTIQGVWSELAMILWSTKPDVAISAWHSDMHNLHDFSAGAYRLEVKSTAKRLREHSFLLDQLGILEPGNTLIASMQVTEDPRGTTVPGLVEQIRARVGANNESQQRLEVIVDESLGLSWREADELTFDLELARTSLRIFSAHKIPVVPQPLPAGVKDVRFTADLSNSEALELENARQIAGLYADLLPLPD